MFLYDSLRTKETQTFLLVFFSLRVREDAGDAGTGSYLSLRCTLGTPHRQSNNTRLYLVNKHLAVRPSEK